MSVESISLALRVHGLHSTTKLVLIGLANHDGDGGSWPSISTLMMYADCSRSTVKRALRDLETAGLITTHVNEGGSARTRADRRPNRYELHLLNGGSQDEPPSDGTGVHPEHERGSTATDPEPSLEPSGTTDVVPSEPSARDITVLFYDHWTEQEGVKPAGWTVPQMIKLIEPFLKAGWSTQQVKLALEQMRLDGTTYTRQTIEQRLRGRTRATSRMQEGQRAFEAGVAAFHRQAATTDVAQLPGHRPDQETT